MFDFLTPVVVQTGLCCLATQCIFYVLFAYILPKGPWTDMPGFTAHQVVALPLQAYLAYQGMMAWYFYAHSDNYDAEIFDTPVDRILKLHPTGLQLSEIAVGMQLFWDTPLGFIIPALNDPLKLAHHIGMFLTASQSAGSFGRSIGSYHALFYMGVIEISTLPLVFVDLFHPKHKPWFQYFKGNDSPSFLQPFNEVCRIAFALSFLVVRGILFPYEVFTRWVPDILHVASLSPEERDGAALPSLYLVLSTSVLFSLLQLHWAVLIAKQLLKKFVGGEKKKV
uniref:TLC domain-containing protein n=1 Tax=Helicotheca tamesis TaxID=374047 RepID=A0A7S2N5A4_9STRA|mmetsp:Transcript_9725/g.13624  ORF Transcript_9725/g.13624 Transcript_9725/m.13624 type:complete len:281 (+) Transcript_9725:139-981(+)